MSKDYELNVISKENESFCKNSLFYVRNGLDGTQDSVSFESYNSPGYFLRTLNFIGKMELNQSSDLFKKDASFFELSSPNR